MACRIRIEDLTEVDIAMYKKEIEKFEAKKKKFHTFGIIFLIIFIISLVGTIAYSVLKVVNVKPETDSFIDLMTFFVLKLSGLFSADTVVLIASIGMFVLESALCGTKIRNRQRVIAMYEAYHAQENKNTDQQ